MPRHGENIRKRKDNRWEGRYIKYYAQDGKAKYGSVYGKTYYEVKQKLNEAKMYIHMDALSLKDNEKTFREVLFIWLDRNKINLKEQTYNKYLYLIQVHLVPWFYNMKMHQINAASVNQFLYEKSVKGRLDGQGGLSPNYVQTLYYIIQAAMNMAVTEQLCKPFDGEIKRPSKKKKELEILNLREQNILTEYLLQDCDDKKIGVLLSLCMGLRLGEVCGLMWEDIDFSSHTIHVHRTVERIRNMDGDFQKTKLSVGSAKTDSSNRVIPMPSYLFPILKAQSEMKCQNFVVAGKIYEYSDPRSLQYSFQKYLNSCGIRHINYHALRHTFATRCIEVGMDVKSLSEILGHANVNITLNTYVHSSMDLKRKQIEMLTPIYSQYMGQQQIENA